MQPGRLQAILATLSHLRCVSVEESLQFSDTDIIFDSSKYGYNAVFKPLGNNIL